MILVLELIMCVGSGVHAFEWLVRRRGITWIAKAREAKVQGELELKVGVGSVHTLLSLHIAACIVTAYLGLQYTSIIFPSLNTVTHNYCLLRSLLHAPVMAQRQSPSCNLRNIPPSVWLLMSYKCLAQILTLL